MAKRNIVIQVIYFSFNFYLPIFAIISSLIYSIELNECWANQWEINRWILFFIFIFVLGKAASLSEMDPLEGVQQPSAREPQGALLQRSRGSGAFEASGKRTFIDIYRVVP